MAKELISKYYPNKPKTPEDMLLQLIDDMDFDTLIVWADYFDVEHEENLWLDDMWPDYESELRVSVAEALIDAIQSKQSVIPSKNEEVSRHK